MLRRLLTAIIAVNMALTPKGSDVKSEEICVLPLQAVECVLKVLLVLLLLAGSVGNDPGELQQHSQHQWSGVTAAKEDN